MHAPDPPVPATTTAARAVLRFSSGFTALEVLIVMVVVATLAAVGVARFSGSIQRHRLSLAATQLQNDLRAARALALGQSCTVRLEATVGSGVYSWSAQSGPEAGVLVRRDLGADPWGAVLVTVQGTGGGRVNFNGFGTPDAAASFTLARGELRCVVTLDSDGTAAIGPITRSGSPVIVDLNQSVTVGGQSIQLQGGN